MSHRKDIFFAALLVMAMNGVSCARHAEEEARALYEQGKALRESGKPVEAMQSFLKAAHSGTKDEALAGRVWSNMANMCRQANDHALAFRVYGISAEHFAASGDSLAYGYALNNMAWEQAALGNKDSALMFVEEAVRSQPSEVCRQKIVEKVIETRAAACYFTQDYDSMLVWTESRANDYLLMLRAQAFSFLQQDDSAAYYARLLLPRTTNPFYLDDLYYILTHNDLSADKETVLVLSSERADVQKEIEIQHGKLMQAKQLLEQDLRRGEPEWRVWLTVSAALLFCLFCGFLICEIRRRRHRRTGLSKSLQTLRETVTQQEPAWDDYNVFCRTVDKHLNGLATHLQAFGLNEQDLRICILVMLGVSHKEMADRLNCSPKSVGKLKDLTARKLGVSGGQLQSKLTGCCLN